MKVVLVQIYRFSTDHEMLRKMAAAFLMRGYRMILWSNKEYGTAGLPMIPLSRGIKDDILYALPDSNFETDANFCNWQAFEKLWEDRYSYHEPAYDTKRCYRISHHVFDRIKPDIFLCWCGFNPWFAIPRQEARRRRIPVWVWEAGMLPNSIILDRGGICGESEWCDRELPNPSNLSLINAKKYLETWSESIKERATSEITSSAPATSKRMLVLGSMDSANGVLTTTSTPKSTLPGYYDGIDLAIHISRLHLGKTIYRPHPTEPKLPLRRFDGTNVEVDTSNCLEVSLFKSDVIFGYGSKADMSALALGKPLVICGRGPMTGKGCSYEGLHPNQLEIAILEAIKKGHTEAQCESFIRFTASLMENGHYDRNPTGICRRSIDDLVDDVLRGTEPTLLKTGKNRTLKSKGILSEVLSQTGIDWSMHENRMFRLQQRSASPEELAEKFRHHLESIPDALPVIDFDHTLWLGNSTEQFIAQATPYIIRDMVDWTTIKIHAKTQRFLSFERDQLRVLAISFLMPWSWITWKIFVRRRFDRYWNHELQESCNVAATRTPIVISLGFDVIIKSIIDEWNRRSGSQLTLIASKLSGKSASLRGIGKVAALEKLFPNLDWNKTVSISDSQEDYDLLLRSKKSLIGKWHEPPFHRKPGYFPFRYVAYGKYAGIGYVKNLIFGRDLIVWMLAYTIAPYYIAPAFLLFLSFHVVYEIGYYENDFTAAKKERNPTLSSQHAQFENYRIELWAWMVALLLGATGCHLASGHLPSSLLIWFSVLLTLRIVFAIYNRSAPGKRIPLYIFLQFLKNFSGAFLMPPTGVGAALLLAHSYQHSAVYIVYRSKGDKSLFKRHHTLITVFVIGVFYLIITNKEISWTHLALAVVWIIHFSLTEINHSFFNLRHYLKVVKRYGQKLLTQ